MRNSVTYIAGAALYLVSVVPLHPAQMLSAQRPQFRPGQRICVPSSSTRPDKIEGEYIGTSGDTLYARTLLMRRTVAIPLASVTRVEHWKPQPNARRGALVGAVEGFAVGFIFANKHPDANSGIGPSLVVPIAALSAAIVAVPGAIIGALIKSGGRWEEVPLERVRVNLAPQRDGGGAVGLSVSF